MICATSSTHYKISVTAKGAVSTVLVRLVPVKVFVERFVRLTSIYSSHLIHFMQCFNVKCTGSLDGETSGACTGTTIKVKIVDA